MTRRERLEAKLEKRLSWAEGRKADAARRFDAAHKIVEMIPLGQPILVGHHSERRHRAAIDRMASNMDKGCESSKMAEHHSSKAAGLEAALEGSIFSDDPDAVEALEARITELEAKRDGMKRTNSAFKKAKGADHAAKLAALVDSGVLTRDGAIAIARFWALCPYHAGRCHPTYELTNLGGNIRRLKQRIQDVKTRQARAAKADEAGGVAIEGTGEYVRVTFAEKPSRAILEAMKAAGFRWGGGSWTGKRVDLPKEISEASPNAGSPAE